MTPEDEEAILALLRLAEKYIWRAKNIPNPHHAAGRARTGGIPWRGKR